MINESHYLMSPVAQPPGSTKLYIGSFPPPKPPNTTRLICVSQTLSRDFELTLPAGDIYINVGNFTANGSLAELQHFIDYVANLDYNHKIILLTHKEKALEHYRSSSLLILNGAATLINGLRIQSVTRIVGGCAEYKSYFCANDVILSSVPPICPILSQNGKTILTQNLLLYPPRVIIFNGPAECHGAMWVTVQHTDTLSSRILFVNPAIFATNQNSPQYGLPVTIDLENPANPS